MGIQIIIEGNHVTDVLAEIRTLANAVDPKPASKPEAVIHTVRDVEQSTYEPEPLNGPELDSNGIPWDERIHSSSKKKTSKGVWVKRKGVQPDVYEKVTKELEEGDEEPAIVEAEQITDSPPEEVKEEPAVVEVAEEPEVQEEEKPVINRESLMELISKVTKGPDGKDDQARYKQVFELVKGVVPAKQTPKISNIPDAKIEEVYYEIAAIE